MCSDQTLRGKSPFHRNWRRRARSVLRAWNGREGVFDHRSRYRASARFRLCRNVECGCIQGYAGAERQGVRRSRSQGQRGSGSRSIRRRTPGRSAPLLKLVQSITGPRQHKRTGVGCFALRTRLAQRFRSLPAVGCRGQLACLPGRKVGRHPWNSCRL